MVLAVEAIVGVEVLVSTEAASCDVPDTVVDEIPWTEVDGAVVLELSTDVGISLLPGTVLEVDVEPLVTGIVEKLVTGVNVVVLLILELMVDDGNDVSCAVVVNPAVVKVELIGTTDAVDDETALESLLLNVELTGIVEVACSDVPMDVVDEVIWPVMVVEVLELPGTDVDDESIDPVVSTDAVVGVDVARPLVLLLVIAEVGSSELPMEVVDDVKRGIDVSLLLLADDGATVIVLLLPTLAVVELDADDDSSVLPILLLALVDDVAVVVSETIGVAVVGSVDSNDMDEDVVLLELLPMDVV